MRRAFVERWERRDVGTRGVEGNDARLAALSTERERELGAEGISCWRAELYVTREESQFTRPFARGESIREVGHSSY